MIFSTRLAFATLVFTTVAFLGPLGFGVWTPDLLTHAPRVLADQTKNGQRFQVVQSWEGNRYTTDLVQVWPDGARSTYLLDGNDYKQWDAHLCIAARGHRTVVTLPDRPSIIVRWQRIESSVDAPLPPR